MFKHTVKRIVRPLAVASLITYATQMPTFAKAEEGSAEDFFKNKPQIKIGTQKHIPMQYTVKPFMTREQRKEKKYQDQLKSKKIPEGDYRILVFGETGSGKSTFINTLTNYYLKGDLDKLRVSIPTKFHHDTENFRHNEADVRDTSRAQTQDVTEYKFDLDKKTTFRIMDTPGLNDTEGYEKDEANLEKIIESITKVDKLAGIVLVINGTNARATHNIKSLLNKFNGFLPDSIMSNIIVVFTMCRRDTCNFNDLKLLGIKPAKVFYMNNTAFSSDPSKWDDTTMLELEWDQSMNACNQLSHFLTSLSNVSTYEFEQMRKIRNTIKTNIQDAKLEILNLQRIQEEYQKAVMAAEKFNATADEFKDYTVQKTIPQEQMVDAPYHSTICTKCNKVCHDHCGLDEIDPEVSDKNTHILNCSCFHGGNKCSNCECDETSHFHARKTMETVMVTLDEEIEDLKNKYMDAMKNKEESEEELSEKEIIQNSIKVKIANIITKIKINTLELKKICKNYNLVNDLNDLIHKLKQEKELLSTVEAKETAETFIVAITELCDHFKDLRVDDIEKLKEDLNMVEDHKQELLKKTERKTKKQKGWFESLFG